MDFNVNEEVLVKLTDFGRKALEQQYLDSFSTAGIRPPQPYQPPREDAEGWSKWQLWVLMRDLGHLCQWGLPQPFEGTIRFAASSHVEANDVGSNGTGFERPRAR